MNEERPETMERCPLVKLPEAASHIGVTEQTLWRWTRKNLRGIPVYGTGRTLRFDLDELRGWFRDLRTSDQNSLEARNSQ